MAIHSMCNFVTSEKFTNIGGNFELLCLNQIHSLDSRTLTYVRSNNRDIHPSATPSAALQLIRRLHPHEGI